MRYGVRDLGIPGLDLARSTFELGEMGRFVAAGAWDWSRVAVWHVLPVDLCGAPMPDPGWSLSERLPRHASQREIDRCAALTYRWILKRCRAMGRPVAVFEDYFARRETLEFPSGVMVEPLTDRHYMLAGPQLRLLEFSELLDHCSNGHCGGVVIGRRLGEAGPGAACGWREAPLIERMELFCCNGFDDEALMVVSPADLAIEIGGGRT